MGRDFVSFGSEPFLSFRWLCELFLLKLRKNFYQINHVNLLRICLLTYYVNFCVRALYNPNLYPGLD